MRIYFVRHTEVASPFVGKYNGHIDISLSSQGRLEAKKLSKKLSHICFDAVYCSDLLRARETLQPFLPLPNVFVTPLLREKSWGRYEGKGYEDIVADGIEYHNFFQWVEALGGESLEAFQKRVVSFFHLLLKQHHTKETILVITHSGVIKTLLGYTKGWSLERSFSYSLPYGEYLLYRHPKGFMV